MYPENNRVVDNLVQDLTELPILHVGEYKFKYFHESSRRKVEKLFKNTSEETWGISFKIMSH